MVQHMGRMIERFWMALFILTLAGSPVHGEILEQIYARVGDAIILKSEYEVQERIMLNQLRANGVDVYDDDVMRSNRKRLLDNMINEQLLIQRAGELGIKATDAQIDEFINSIKEQNNITTQDELLAALRSEGLTYEGLRESLAKRIIIESIKQQEVLSNIVTTEDELKTYYEEHKEDYRQEERIRLGEIVLLFDPDKPREETAKEADRIYDLLVKGADFAELATFVSQTPSREHGGDLGYIERGMLAPEIEKVAYSLKPGEISRPVKTKFGYHILKLVGQKGESYKPFEDVKAQIQQTLREEKFEQAYKAYIDGLRDKTYVEVLMPGLGEQTG